MLAGKADAPVIPPTHEPPSPVDSDCAAVNNILSSDVPSSPSLLTPAASLLPAPPILLPSTSPTRITGTETAQACLPAPRLPPAGAPAPIIQRTASRAMPPLRDAASALPTPPPTQSPDPATTPDNVSPFSRPPCPPLAWSEDLPFLRTSSAAIRAKRDAILEHMKHLADREEELKARYEALQDREELIATRLRDATFRLKAVSAEMHALSMSQGDIAARERLKERQEVLERAIHELYSQQAALRRDKLAFNKMRDETYDVWEFTSCPELEAERAERERIWAARGARRSVDSAAAG